MERIGKDRAILGQMHLESGERDENSMPKNKDRR
jgi:hypothetical protein